MSESPSYRAVAVRYGERETTYGDAYYRWPSYGEPDGPLRIDYYFWVLQPLHDPGAPPIVVDCGFDPQLGERLGRQCRCPPAEALARLEIDPAAVRLLIITHIHWDHVGNLALFPNARIAVARLEFDFWTSNPVAGRPQFAQHSDPVGVRALRDAAGTGRVALLGERTELVPGIVAAWVGGHAPGQLILQVAGENGPVLLASDAVHYYDELANDRPFAIARHDHRRAADGDHRDRRHGRAHRSPRALGRRTGPRLRPGRRAPDGLTPAASIGALLRGDRRRGEFTARAQRDHALNWRYVFGRSRSRFRLPHPIQRPVTARCRAI